jgi:hypothetical protein
MVGLAPQQVDKIIDTRWADVKDDSVCQLAQIVASLSPRAIMVCGEDGWLVLEPRVRNMPAPAGPWESSTRYLLLPPPISDEVVAHGIAKARCRDSDILREFARHFGGCRHMPPGCNGAYYMEKNWETLFDYWQDDYPLPAWYPEWRAALVMYVNMSGDGALLHPNGKVAWDWFAEGEITAIAEDFTGFVKYLVEHKTITPPDL